ncbi:MAG: helix-turn-helix transcriptional regulator [Pyrinomonadaceae bacterium]|nr:helix-turn-helix transcriptional regulator [Phycisphaerales bacterium]
MKRVQESRVQDTPFVKIAKALADPTRHQMLREIRAAGELTCSGVCDHFQLSQPTISHHVKTLHAAGVIDIRKQGQFHVLSVNEARMKAFADDLLPPKRSRQRRTTKQPAAAAARSRKSLP